MYIPTWLIIVLAVVAYFVYKSKSGTNISNPSKQSGSIDDIEGSTEFLKERIFELEHIDSPHFIDYQNAFDAMEVNYLRLKQRLSHTPEKVLEIAKDWHKYAEALGDLKHGRVMLDLDWDDGAWDRAEESSKEPSIIKDEVEKKFKSLLAKDWQKIPDDYFERMEKMDKSDKKPNPELDDEEIGDDWKYYYKDCANLYNLEEKRQKETKEREAKKENAEK